MRAGKFNERVTFQVAQVAAKHDASGGPSERTFRSMKRWAQVLPTTTGDEFLDEDRIDSEITHKVRIRWEKGVGYDFINTDSYIEWQGLKMNIINYNINRVRGFVEIKTRSQED